MKNNVKKHFTYNFIFLLLLLSKSSFAQEPKLMLPIGHISSVSSATFSRDGKKIVTASDDYTAKIWDVESGKLLANLAGHNGHVNTAIFSPDGKKIITASDDETAKIWDVESGKLLANLTGHNGDVKTAIFSPDGKNIVTGSSDKTSKIWDVESGRLITDLIGHIYGIYYTNFSPDGKKIVTQSWYTTKIWDVKSGKPITDLPRPNNDISSATFSPDGKKIVTASDDETFKIWDVESGKLIADLTGHTYGAHSASFSSDGKKIVTGSGNGTVKIWDVESQKLIKDLLGHTKEVRSTTFSPDGLKIVSCSHDQTVKIWDVESGKLITDLIGHNGRVITAIFSPDGKKIVSASDDETAKIWDVESRKLFANLAGYANAFYYANFSPDGKRIVTISSKNITKIFDIESGELIANLIGHNGRVNTAIFSPDGKKIVTASNDKTSKIWDIESGRLIRNLSAHTEEVFFAIFSPDGMKIITGSGDRTAKVWDVESGKLIADLEKHTESVISAKVTFDGKQIITTSDDKSVKIWNLESGEFIGNLMGEQILVDYSAFSVDGRIIVTTFEGKRTKIWNTRSGNRIADLNGRDNEIITSAAFSLDGKKIVTVLYGDIAKIWDVESGKFITDLIGHSSWVKTANFSIDGKKVVTASDDSIVKIWDVESGKLIRNLAGHTSSAISAVFSYDGKKILTISHDSTAKIWDSESGLLLYTILELNQSDYLVYDSNGRYDGTEAARDYLYFTCGTEIIDLTQMKDALYVPGLVGKILNGQDINYPKLSDLDICDALPLVEQIENTESNYFYQITPRKLGLEYVEVYVNDKKVMNVSKVELREENGLFYLKLKEADVKKHFINEEENKINVVAIAQQNGNELRSRGAIVVSVNEKKKSAVTPKLFAVMIGVNDYKDQALKLNYPVKDANELGNAIELSAQKLLGKNNVVMYHINSNVKAGNGYTTPEKEGIKRALADIGQKAQPEDLILLFFAGHGVMQSGNEKLFTFLTAEASQSNQIGITTKELQNWLSYEGPNKILANKTILIFDACNSGQATQELMAMARSDVDTRRIRQVEDLKDKSGMFILAASAPNQVAYELPQYEQGLLTYSLLSVLKNNPDILDDDKYLNVQKWFLESEKHLQELMASLGLKQDAQPFGTANIRIGEVDQEVKQSIQLAVEKPMVICANVLNDATFDDDLGLKMIINTKLSEIAERGMKQSIAYPRKETENANKINIRYTLKDQTIACEVRLLKSGEILHNTKISGIKSNIDGLVTDIIQEIIKYAK